MLAAVFVIAVGCGASDDVDVPEALPRKPGCRAHLLGTLRQEPIAVPAPSVSRSNGPPITGAWAEDAHSHVYVPGPSVDVPCGAPSTVLDFPRPIATGRLSSQIHVTVPPGPSGEPADVVVLSPEAVDPANPTAGPSFTLEADYDYTVVVDALDGSPDICKSSTTVFPVATPMVMPAKSSPPPVGFKQLSSDVMYEWNPSQDWKYPPAKIELEDVRVVFVCESDWWFSGGYQLTYEDEIDGIATASAQHDFWFEGELRKVTDEQILGYYRVYDIAVRTSGSLTGSYSGVTEMLIAVEGFYEKDVDGEQYVDLPYFSGTGVTWSFTLDVLGTPISQSNPEILQDHFERLNLLLPQSPDRPGYFRIPAHGQKDTISGFRNEGFVIVNWGLTPLVAP